ncbi:MAG: ABC transporter substrate-binding protein [Candidatus Omnitrophota bacterium]
MKRMFSLIIIICLVCGLAVPLLADETGVTDTEILIGSSSALEGDASYLGIQTNNGFMAYLNSVNAAGGVNGRKLKLIALNDGYEPLPCVEMTKKLINEYKVFMLANYVGTPTSVKAYLVWTYAKIPATGFFTGAEALRKPFNRYNIHIRGSYYKELSAIIDVFVKELGLKKIAVFYQDDAFGESVKKAAEIALEKFKMVPIAYGIFERNTLKIEEGLAKIKDSQPEAIVMVGTYAPLARFVKEAKKSGLTKTFFHTVSFVGPEALAANLGADSDNVFLTLVMPPYAESNLPIVKEYLGALSKYYPNDSANFVSLEGFVNAKVMVEGLRRAGRDLTREKYINAIETIKPGEMGSGLKFNYGPTDHEGLTDIYIAQIKNGKYVEVKDQGSVRK